MRGEEEGVGFTWVDVICCPRIKRASVSLATDVADGGVGSYPCCTLLVVTLVVGSKFVAF